ncbi:MAG TPA: sulfite exporter TauE/SafE family protein [Gemmatimonadaceae bacterium]|nr:sulfite exporter TauE/SafE family protein [Gemmatimonadaceae bacterium]
MNLIFVGVGLLAGTLSGLFGIGGGVIIVPSLILIAGLAPLTATGTSLGALLLPVGLLGAWEYYRKGHLNIPASLFIALGLFIGVWFGAKLAQQLTPTQLKRAFAIFLVLIAGRMWFS